ncbi:MAG: MsnO8 family LLM class oxidoreductase [Kordiimonadaceae bacterium]|jgi:luciferase family oxidoreductase group 1|nr:MsnO8 family LLM class oxidoreductase [Kordiimonadaceae bacterium]MBT6036838.1 MsnO8 family LLM class oxidoreductase [Kordiimonadaceae bacterium]MBT6330906.1 MsnO8 family LLM class oxidoreductase [Kordiimonadaceae bacterium]MBT7583282.1 MsnO8 family LLM class oxidoreductase [Kordiimonadaceae bacterium]
MKLTVVDQSPIQLGSKDKRPAPQLSVELAKNCEKWGYSRYWLAEHHNANYFSGPSPETLISHIASQTNTIRVGSGGVMLSHYSPYMVAEQFRLLATLFPDRIDLGIGRAPGGDQLASHALSYPGNATHGEVYSRQAFDLKSYLEGGFDDDHPFKDLIVSPYTDYNPELWMLGTSGGSAELAGYLGYNLSLGLFVAPTGQKYDIIETYKNAYVQAGHKGEPKIMVAVGGACADTSEEADYYASSQLYKKTLAQTRGDDQPWVHPDEAQDGIKNFSPREHRFYNLLKESFVIGSPADCEEKLNKLKTYWQTDEFAFLTVTHDFESRQKSYQLIAERMLG